MIDRTVSHPLGDDPSSARLLYGQDVRESLKLLPDCSVHMVATSPPYWGLRDYGVEGQLGLEPTPEQYIENMVEVFREVRRVLRDDGTLWLNLGDSYFGGGSTTEHGQDPRNFASVSTLQSRYTAGQATRPIKNREHSILKTKDLVGIPWMMAFALRADGWYLRSDIIWAKNAVMPESVRDRPTKAHEYVFLLTKSDRYFYDQEAIKESATMRPQVRYTDGRGSKDEGYAVHRRAPGMEQPMARNKRTVWMVNPKPYPGAHFACWPEDLVEPMIKAGSSEKGCCSTCGVPCERVISRKVPVDDGRSEGSQYVQNRDALVAGGLAERTAHRRLGQAYQDQLNQNPVATVGWRPPCECDACTAPCTVLDPFSGSATTGAVALRLGRNYIGTDLNEDYYPLAEARLLGHKPPAAQGGEDENVLDLFGEIDG